MVYKSSSIASAGGGSVTQINTGTGLTGGPITSTGTISIEDKDPNTLAGFDNTGEFAQVNVGSGLSLSGGILTASGGGSSAFNAITTGTNTTATMTVGTGASIVASGSGSITATAVPLSGISGLGSGVATFLATPSSANLAAAVTGETGSGALVFATSPTLVTPVLGAATATSVNGLTLTSSTGSLTIANGKTLTASNTITFTGTDGVSLNVTNVKPSTVGFTASASPLTTGKVMGYYTAPYSGSIAAWSIGVNAGTATVKVWKVATGTAVPTISNVINTSGVAISTGTYIRSTTLTDFTTTTVTANDIFAFDITAVSTATEITFQLEIART